MAIRHWICRSSLIVLVACAAAAAAAPSDDLMTRNAAGMVTGYRLPSDRIFEKGGSGLSESGKALLNTVFKGLGQDSALRVSVVAFTDSDGTEGLNLTDSEAQARSVKAYLLALGFAPSRLAEAKGEGSKDPIADNGSADGKSRNRRVELRFLTPGSPAVAPVVPAAAASDAAVPPTDTLSQFAFGVGYPDLRMRVGLGPDWNLEAKAAFGQGLQVYSGRLFWDFVQVGPLKVLAGGEAGWAHFDDVDSISGDGAYGEAFAGLEYPFSRRFRLSVDVGPAWLHASAQGQTYSSTDVIYNTALYFYIF